MSFMTRNLDITHQNNLLEKGDFITSPKISNIFSEMIAIWLINTWENFGRPKNLIVLNLDLETEV